MRLMGFAICCALVAAVTPKGGAVAADIGHRPHFAEVFTSLCVDTFPSRKAAITLLEDGGFQRIEDRYQTRDTVVSAQIVQRHARETVCLVGSSDLDDQFQIGDLIKGIETRWPNARYLNIETEKAGKSVIAFDGGGFVMVLDVTLEVSQTKPDIAVAKFFNATPYPPEMVTQ